MNISTKISIYLISVILAFVSGFFLNYCNDRNILPPKLIDNNIVFRDSTMKKIKFDTLEAKGEPIIMPKITIPNDNMVADSLIAEQHNIKKALKKIGVKINYIDTIRTNENDIIIVDFDLLNDRFETKIIFTEREVPIVTNTYISKNLIEDDPFYKNTKFVGIVSGLLGFILGILIMVGVN